MPPAAREPAARRPAATGAFSRPAVVQRRLHPPRTTTGGGAAPGLAPVWARHCRARSRAAPTGCRRGPAPAAAARRRSRPAPDGAGSSPAAGLASRIDTALPADFPAAVQDHQHGQHDHQDLQHALRRDVMVVEPFALVERPDSLLHPLRTVSGDRFQAIRQEVQDAVEKLAGGLLERHVELAVDLAVLDEEDLCAARPAG